MTDGRKIIDGMNEAIEHAKNIPDDTVERIAAAMWPEIGTDYSWQEAVDRAAGKIPDEEHSQVHHIQTTDYARALARAALSAMPQQEVTVKEADIEKAVLVLLGKSKEHALGVDYVASRTMKKSEWCERMKAALRAISEGE